MLPTETSRRSFLRTLAACACALAGVRPVASEPEPFSAAKYIADFDRANLNDDIFECRPIVFDDAMITTALLHEELFPLVQTQVVRRGQ